MKPLVIIAAALCLLSCSCVLRVEADGGKSVSVDGAGVVKVIDAYSSK